MEPWPESGEREDRIRTEPREREDRNCTEPREHEDQTRTERREREDRTRTARRALEDRIHTLARSQHGVVTRAQLLAIGLSSAAIGRRLQSGRLRATHRGVYLLDPVPRDRAAEMAAVLAGGPTALLSHTSALWCWGMRESRGPGPIHVSVPGSGRGRRAGVHFHRVAELATDERAVVAGIPITSPGRTLVDSAGMLGSHEIEQAAALAERQGLIGSHELAALTERYNGRPGVAGLRAILAYEGSPALTRSEAERRCLELLRSARLPPPRANVLLGPYELDLFWPAEGVAVEVDGWAHHSSRLRFEGDRRKDTWLRARGIEVVRLSWRQITREPMPTAVQIGAILAVARTRRTPVLLPPAGSAHTG
jgi:very-short-patch-repair endonuclease